VSSSPAFGLWNYRKEFFEQTESFGAFATKSGREMLNLSISLYDPSLT
jgi:hypothetical protein